MARHVLVSGGSRGLGQAIVADLLAAGYAVSTFSRSETEFVRSVRDSEHGPRFFSAAGDLSDEPFLAGFVKEAASALGPPWALVNNAALAHDGVLASTPPDHIRHLVDVNVTGTLLLTRLAVRRMLLRRAGRVVNISSIVGIRGYRGLATYAATKAAVDGMTRALARELGGANITVNSILPGYMETDMSAGLDAGQMASIVGRTPLGRLGTPADCMGLLRFLLSDEAGFITGQSLVVDGGITC